MRLRERGSYSAKGRIKTPGVALVKEVMSEVRRIVVDAPEGLFELEEEK